MVDAVLPCYMFTPTWMRASAISSRSILLCRVWGGYGWGILAVRSVHDFLRAACPLACPFICHGRGWAGGISWNVQPSLGTGLHGSDRAAQGRKILPADIPGLPGLDMKWLKKTAICCPMNGTPESYCENSIPRPRAPAEHPRKPGLCALA